MYLPPKTYLHLKRPTCLPKTYMHYKKTYLPPKTYLHLIVGGVDSQVGECLVRLCHQGWRPLAEELPRALGEVDSLTRNPEKLANAFGRCRKDTLGRKMSFRTHRPPYPTRRGLVTAWLARDQETLTGRNLDGQCQGGLKEKKSKTINWEVTKNKKRSLEESCESLIAGPPTEERKEEVASTRSQKEGKALGRYPILIVIFRKLCILAHACLAPFETWA